VYLSIVFRILLKNNEVFTPKLKIVESIKGMFNSSSPKFNSITESGMGLVFRANHSKQIDDDKQDDDYGNLLIELRKTYMNMPLVQGQVDIKTDQTIQEFHFEGPSKVKNTKFADEQNLMQFFHRICKLMLIYGNGYVEVVKSRSGKIQDLKILNTEWMRVIRKSNGDVIGYLQKVAGKDAIIWGSTGNANRDALLKKLPLKNISHFRYNVIGSEKYGTSMFHSSLPMISVKSGMESDLQKLMKRYISPLIHLKVGNDDLPASSGDIATVSSEVQDINSESEFVTSHLVEANVLGFDKKGVEITAPFTHVDTQIIAGGQVPSFLLGMGAGVDRAVAEVGLRSFGRHIKSIQRSLKVQYEDQIIVKHGLGTNKDKLVWNQADERDTDLEVEQVRGLVTDGIITPQKANDLLAEIDPKFAEKLPNPVELATPRPGQGKGGDKISQLELPNDPTKSTRVKPGKRVVKSDVKKPGDDK